jgi:hypothetical protein
MHKTSLAAFGLVLLASPAAASDADELKKSGLTGHWAFDCAKPPSDDNIHQTWSALEDGRVKLTVDRDEKDTRPDPLLGFETVSEQYVSYYVTSDDEKHEIMLKLEKDRYRVWYSGNRGLAAGYAEEKAYVKNGKSTGNGKDMPWYTRCEK